MLQLEMLCRLYKRQEIKKGALIWRVLFYLERRSDKMDCVINIDSKGYGKIYKAVMRDRELPLLAKSIYAYFCSYAGCGYQVYPKRDKIVRDLKINKDTYTKHLGFLIGRGYIAKERTAAGNLYTIRQSVPSYRSDHSELEGLTDYLICDSVAAHGFGTVPKLVMLDQNLTPQAKAIYAYFAAFAGAGTTSFPRRTTILRELRIGSAGTYYRHFNLLVEYGYLSVEQRKNNGRFDICLYRLNSMVYADVSEKLEHGTSKGEAGMPMSEKLERGGKLLKVSLSSSEKPMSEKAISDKMEPQNIGRYNNNSENITNSIQEKEQEYNHQHDENQPAYPAYTPAMVMELIGGEQLKAEFASWGSLLKNTLGQLQTAEEERRYFRITGEILTELVNQLTAALNVEEKTGRMLQIIQSQAFSSMIDGFLERWDTIRHVKSYVAAAIKNLVVSNSE